MTVRLVTPILVTVFMPSFVGLFGEFMLASIFLRDVDSQTLGAGLCAMIQGQHEQVLRPVLCRRQVASLPVVLLSLGFQEQLVGGLTQGSVK